MKKQQQNEKHPQMKIHNIKNEQQHKILLEVLPREFLTFDFENDYKINKVLNLKY